MHALPSGSTRRHFGRPARPDIAGLGVTPAQVWIICWALLYLYLIWFQPLPGGAKIGVTVLTTILAGFLGFGSIKDRPCDDWLSPLTQWVAVVARRQQTWTSPDGKVKAPPTVTGWKLGSPRITPPGADQVELGILSHKGEGAACLVMQVFTPSFLLVDDPFQHARLREWGTFLAGCADPSSPVDRVQIIQRVTPINPGTSMAGLHFDELATADPDGAYSELLDETGTGLCVETYMVLRVTNGSIVRAGDTDLKGGAAIPGVLYRQYQHAATALPSLHLAPLDGHGLRRLIATLWDPFNVTPQRVWPAGTETRFGSFTADGATHMTGWMAGLPATVVDPAWFGVFATADTFKQLPRVTSIVMGFVPADKAMKRVRNRQTSRDVGRSIRSEQGRREGAKEARAQEAIDQQENALSYGHPLCRVAGFVTVSGRTPAEAKTAWRAARSTAQTNGVALRLLSGEQHTAFTHVVLPTAKGAL